MECNRSAMKDEVKACMRQTKPRAMLVTLVYLAVSLVLNAAISWLETTFAGSTGFDAWLDVIQRGPESQEELLELLEALAGSAGSLLSAAALIGVLSAVVKWTLSYGYKGYCMDAVRGRETSFVRLACAFPCWGWVLLNRLLAAVFTALWALLFSLGGVAVTVVMAVWVQGSMGITLTIVAWIAVAVLSVAFSLRYALADYVLLDDGVDSLQALGRSKALMRGRKWQFFVLGISFIGWFLLMGLIETVVGGIVMIAAAGVSGLAGGDLIDMLESMAQGSYISNILAWLCALPLALWLNPYIAGAFARFYDLARQADEGEQPDEWSTAPAGWDDGSWNNGNPQ